MSPSRGQGWPFWTWQAWPTAEQQNALLVSLQSRLGHDRAKAEEAMILGRWLVTKCGGPDAALKRFTRKLIKMQGSAALQPLLQVIKDVATTGADQGGALSPRQRDALDEISRAFKLG